MKRIHRFYSYEDTKSFLITFDFVYKIPKFKEDCYYEIYLSSDGKVVEAAYMIPFVNLCTSRIIEFFNKYKMTYSYFGCEKERFIIDKNLIELVKSKKKKRISKQWNGRSYKEIINRTEEGIYDFVLIGKLKVSIQGGKYFCSTPKEDIDIKLYTHLEIALFYKSRIIYDEYAINELLYDFEYRDYFINRLNKLSSFEYIEEEYIQKLLVYLKKNKKKIYMILDSRVLDVKW